MPIILHTATAKVEHQLCNSCNIKRPYPAAFKIRKTEYSACNVCRDKGVKHKIIGGK